MSELKLPHRHGDERTDKVVDALPDIGAITTVADAMKHLGIRRDCASSGCCAMPRNASLISPPPSR